MKIKKQPTLTDSICDLRARKIKQTFFTQLNTLIDWKFISKIISQDITIDLGVNNPYTITPEAIDNGSFDNCSLSLSIDINTFDIIGVFPVTLTAEDGFQSATSIANVTVIDSTIVVIDNELSNLKIYPNPTNDLIFLEINNSIIVKNIKVYDLMGKLLVTYNKRPQNISLNNYSNGLYFIKINSDKGSIIKKIVKKQ